MKHVLILGAGFGGLELSARLSDELGDEVRVTLIDQADSFVFGFSKLDLMFDRPAVAEPLPYSELSREGVEFRQERITSIDPEARRAETDGGSYEADILVVALGADYDLEATPGLTEAGYEFYSVVGAERLRSVIPDFESGTALVGILGHPYKCPPAPFEAALLLHEHLLERGRRDAVEIRVAGPISAPVPITAEVSAQIREALDERGIEFLAETQITELDPERNEAKLESGDALPFDLFLGVPVHRAPEVVRASALTDGDWVPVDRANLMTPFENVYAIGDLTALPMARAGVFAEAGARTVAEDIAARLRGRELEHPYEGAGNCYIEFGGGRVAYVEANFLGGPKPTARLVGPSKEIAAEKPNFAAERRERWFG